MTTTVSSFQSTFPEFSNTTTYPPATIGFWIALGYDLLNANRWDPNIIDYAVCLYIAHNLVIGQRNQAASAAGGAPGAMQGPQTSKSVDKVAVGYDTGAITFEDAPFWNMTSYGVQLMMFIRITGAGGIQL